MLEDFVDVRGGGLLVLGGARSFGEGGWAGTPLADALPVVLDRGVARSRSTRRLELVVRPTRAGPNHPATQITDKEADAAAKWRDLPPLTSLNPIRDDQARRDGAADRASTSGAASRSCWRISATAAARRWRCPCRTPGCGACTRRWT